jgi:hypothetical protein
MEKNNKIQAALLIEHFCDKEEKRINAMFNTLFFCLFVVMCLLIVLYLYWQEASVLISGILILATILILLGYTAGGLTKIKNKKEVAYLLLKSQQQISEEDLIFQIKEIF